MQYGFNGNTDNFLGKQLPGLENLSVEKTHEFTIFGTAIFAKIALCMKNYINNLSPPDVAKLIQLETLAILKNRIPGVFSHSKGK